MGERQMATTIDQIRGDHVARYRFAAERAGATVLDVGCGCGYGSWFMANAGKVVYGVDHSGAGIDFACEVWSHSRVLYYLMTLPDLPVGVFETAVMFEVIEHLDDPLATLQAVVKVAPQIIVSVPNEAIVPYVANPIKYHKRHYTEKELEQLLATAGYLVTEWWCQEDPYVGEVKTGTNGRTLIAIAERIET